MIAQVSTVPRNQNSASTLLFPPRIGVLGETSLSLPDVISFALANNKDIENSRIDQVIAHFSLTAARGAYDPRVGANTLYERAVTPVSSVIGGGPNGQLLQRQYVLTPALNGLIPATGGSYEVTLGSQRVYTNNTFVTLNPQYPTHLTFSLRQPLWRGLRFDANRQRTEIARKNLNLTDAQFRQIVTDVATEAEKAYWDLVLARRNLEVQIEAASAAQRQVESNRRMADRGILAPIDVVEAETQLATFQRSVFNAQATLTQAENRLKVLILPDRSSPVWPSALVPTTPINVQPPLLPLADAVNEALENRPELAQVKIASEINRINLRYSRELTKPQIDVVASYTSAGLAGSVLPAQPNPFTGGLDAFVQRINALSLAQGLTPLPAISIGSGGGVTPLLVGGYGQSLSTLAGWNFPTVQAGLQISIPLRNRTAEANVSAASAEIRRSNNRRLQMEQQIEGDVRSAMQQVESAKNGLEAAQSARHSAQEQYASEQRKFQAGTSTVFLVLQRQTAMIASQTAELQAQRDLGKSIADLERATGQTLTVHSILIQDTAASPQRP